VEAIAKGADPAFLIGKQDELKAEKQRNADRLEEIEGRLEAMPDREVLKHEATAIRSHLLQKVQNRNWRKLSFDEIRRFLVFLFGENPGKAGDGICVMQERGRWKISFQGKVRFFHELVDGRPDSYLMGAVAERLNKKARREFDRFVNLTRQT